jgi:hypothetical protein
MLDSSPIVYMATDGKIVRSDMLITVGQLYLADYETDFSCSIPGF